MLTIGKFAEAGGVGVETVRFYQRKGLLEVPHKDGGIRKYGEEDLRRLNFIRKAQIAGFTLKEIEQLILLDSGHDRNRARNIASVRLNALNMKISELQQSRDFLEKLVSECKKGSRGPCPILKSFDV
jgi:MerR family mercuric resistance operon transcriptional regulator